MPNLHFHSKVGQRPTFFVPDTGTAGGKAALVGPGGEESLITEDAVLSPPSDTKPDGTPWEPTFGKRVGFRVPFEFAAVGDYRLIVAQDDVVTTYIIHVDPADATHKAIGGAA